MGDEPELHRAQQDQRNVVHHPRVAAIQLTLLHKYKDTIKESPNHTLRTSTMKEESEVSVGELPSFLTNLGYPRAGHAHRASAASEERVARVAGLTFATSQRYPRADHALRA